MSSVLLTAHPGDVLSDWMKIKWPRKDWKLEFLKTESDRTAKTFNNDCVGVVVIWKANTQGGYVDVCGPNNF